jgi:prepilin-type processing-associated H-X9-DG protein
MTYYCPGREAQIPSRDTPPGGIGDYGGCAGSNDGNGAIIAATFTSATDASGATIITSWRGRLTLQSLPDGTSNILMFGEKHIRPNSMRGKNEDRSLYAGNQNNFRRMIGYNNAATLAGAERPLMPPLEQAHPQANASFGGPHGEVTQFVFCDGSVRGISNTVSLVTLTYLGARNDGKNPGDY